RVLSLTGDKEAVIFQAAKKGFMTSLAFTPDGQTLAVVSGGKIHLWDMATRQELPAFESADATCLAFSPKGRTLFAGINTGQVHVWDLAARRKIGTLEGQRV